MDLTDYIQHPVFTAVARVAERRGVRAHPIGGYVRDAILQRPSKDVDFVTEGSGIDLAREVAEELGIEQVNYYKNFGTAMFRMGDFEVEFVGARKESYRRESRNPIVEEGTLEDDQKRRDFTINALAISLDKANYGQVIDPFNGLADLEAGIIRTPLDPEITFSDDPLRMMRAVRFASQLGFEIEESAFNALCSTAPRITIISQERVTTELNKIIESPLPSIGFKLLMDCGARQNHIPRNACPKRGRGT